MFVEKQESADSLLKDLLKRSYPCLSLHGGIFEIFIYVYTRYIMKRARAFETILRFSGVVILFL